jgi:hypothetical protein
MHKRMIWVVLTLVMGVVFAAVMMISSSAQAEGLQWETPVKISDTDGNSGGTRLVVDPQNRVHLVYYDWIDQVSHPPYLQYVQKPINQDWSEPVFIYDETRLNLPGTYGGEPAMVIGPDGALHLVWENYRYLYDDKQKVDVDVVTYLKRDMNGNWSSFEVVPSQMDWPAASQPDIGQAPDGSVHVVYQDWLEPGHGKTIHHIVRNPTGVWTSTYQVTPAEGDYSRPMLAVDGNSNTHLIYTKNYTDHYEFYYANKSPIGNWSLPQNIGFSPLGDNTVEQFTSGPGGNIHLVWIEMDQTVFPWVCAVKYSGKVNLGGWSNPHTIAPHCASQVAVASDIYGRAHVAWISDDVIWYSYQNPEGSFLPPVIVDDSQIHYWEEGLSIAVDRLGGRYVAWNSLEDGDIWATTISGTQVVNTVISSTGGSLYAFSGNTYVQFPSQAVTEDVIVTHSPQKGTAPPNMQGVTYFELTTAKVSDHTPVTSFNQPYTITIYYTDPQIVSFDESSLGLYWWNDGVWEKIPTSVVDIQLNQVVASLDHMTQFGVFGEHQPYLYLPMVAYNASP